MQIYYILDENNKTIPLNGSLIETLEKVEECLRGRKSIVQKDEIDGYEISTIFLAIDHNYRGIGDPLLFETMIFKDNDMGGIYQVRYSTYDEAKIGHQMAVDMIKHGKIQELIDNEN